MYYSKSSILDFVKNEMENRGYIAVDYDLSTVWTKYEDIPTDGYVRFFLIHKTDTKTGKKYGFDIELYSDYANYHKKAPVNTKGIFAELLDNQEQILAGGYVSKAEASRQKKEAAAARKEEKEKMLNAGCKTFNVDFFDENGDYLDAITEIGQRLQNGEYSDLVLNGTVKLSYRTKSKNKNLGYTVSVSFSNSYASYEYDSKYGDLWEDIDDNIRKEILGAMLNRRTFNEEEVDAAFQKSEWVNKYVAAERGDDENPFMYDLLSIYFSPDSYYLEKNSYNSYYANIYDKDALNLGGVLHEYFCSVYPNVKWMNKELNTLKSVPELGKCLEK